MVLKHRDKELLRFEWIEPQGVHVVSVNDAERKFLPLEMKGVASDDYNLPVDRLQKIEDFLQKRCAEILKFGEKADDLLHISQGHDSVNRVTSESLGVQIKVNLSADPFITYEELADVLQVSSSSIARKMKELQSAEEIRRVGADKNGWWDVLK